MSYDLSIFDVISKKVLCEFRIKNVPKNSTILNIRKIDDLVIIYNDAMHVFVYDANTCECIKIFKLENLKNKCGVKVRMPTRDKPNMIIHSTETAIILPINAIQEKSTFLLSSLVHHNECAANNFINSRQFDRHLIPLIFEFLAEF